jgi:transcriptional regulator with XRE-family HTH domain
MLTDSQAMGPALRLLRTRRGLRQYQVADKAGITKAMLSSYEIAGVKPSLQSLTSILNALETDLAEFQQAIDIITGRLDPEELKEQDAPEGSQQTESGDRVLEILVPRLGEVLPLLERIATALEGIAQPAPDKAPPPARKMRQAEGSRPHPRPG